MRWRRRSAEPPAAGSDRPTRESRHGLLSVVIPAYNVAAYLPTALDSVLGQTGVDLEAIVVDDGSTDESGRIADAYAARDDRVRVVHTENAGLGAARNEGASYARGELIAFCDSDDVVPPDTYSMLAATLGVTGSDFVTGSIVRWDGAERVEPPWMKRLHSPPRAGITVDEHPEILGDVFAWNKLFRRSFWAGRQLSWPEGVRYEDQPTITQAYLAGRFDVIPDIVYHWRVRHDGSSITQQRSSVQDLADRMTTKLMALDAVTAFNDPATSRIFLDRVLAGDLHRYFAEIPGCSDEWWHLLREGIFEVFGVHSLVHSGLPPVHRLVGWLVEEGRREDAAAVVTYAAALPGPFPLVVLDSGQTCLDLRDLDRFTGGRLADVPTAAIILRDHELG